MGDVGERAAVNQSGGVLEGLHQVGLDGVLEQGGHSADGLEVGRGDGLAVIGVGDDNAGQAGLEVVDVGGEAEDGHDLGGHGDLEAVLARNALRLAAQAINDVAELTVVHVNRTLPGDGLGVDVEGVALLDMVVEHGSQQVVGSTDGVEVAGEVEVDVLHGDNLSVAAAGSAALDAKDGTQGRLTQGDHGLLADLAQAVDQAHRRGGLTLTSGGGGDGGHEDELAVGLVANLLHEVDVVDLGHVVAVLLKILLIDTGGLGDLGDLLHLCSLCDLDI